ncbi:phytanoyl-CoA dioxygenase family protein [Brevundimonas sp.]|uniref:phytanoyl-CoA dioxygenase family protein n=1 Tax=Brevundimonas sp. TaxID=1871086 RepID=UPI0025B9095F|nr:phytanoyl-CoA dioxygenase family protein [Brevundimonas sp.]
MDLDTLTYDTDGAQRFPGAVADSLVALRAILTDLPTEQAGVRFQGLGQLGRFMAADGVIGSVAASVLGPNARPVRAVLFDKTATTNWSLGWHQDRTICVQRRVETGGFGPWSVKAGMQHVAPPSSILARMVTLRVHLDDVSADNAPLLIAPGSHLEGRVAVNAIDAVVRRHGTVACLAGAGDIWLYATLILHASDAATRPQRRRVLQLDYACEDLPGELEWLGV